ncbi:MAG TPA: hypothetical protein VEV45_03015 [Streptosporangiaceae bacterium]|nr:hypothetical protein [Streptosporangiaceae bacterium]
MSDAAPLPRLGEVFFDVRGNSRSMRLSWYADTGVAVFSIWQAGMCTGTFRLPIADLSRMIEILERGPSPQGRGRAPVSAAHRGPGGGEYPAEDDEIGLLDATSGAGGYAAAGHGSGQYAQGGFDARPSTGGDRGDRGAHSAGDLGAGDRGARRGYDADSGGTADYPAADYGSAGYGADYEQAGYGRQASYGEAGYDQAGYQPADYGAGQPDGNEPAGYGYQPAGYGQGGYPEDDPLRRSGQAAGYGQGGYPEDDPLRRSGQPASGYETGSYQAGAPDYLTGEHPAGGYPDGTPAERGPDYQSGGYGNQPDFPAGGHRRDDGRFAPDPGGPSSAETDGTGYQDERFVPPYVRGGGESYRNDNRGRTGGYGRDADDAGYRADEPPVSPSDGYPEQQWPGEAYSNGSEYRRR